MWNYKKKNHLCWWSKSQPNQTNNVWTFESYQLISHGPVIFSMSSVQGWYHSRIKAARTTHAWHSHASQVQARCSKLVPFFCWCIRVISSCMIYIFIYNIYIYVYIYLFIYHTLIIFCDIFSEVHDTSNHFHPSELKHPNCDFLDSLTKFHQPSTHKGQWNFQKSLRKNSNLENSMGKCKHSTWTFKDHFSKKKWMKNCTNSKLHASTSTNSSILSRILRSTHTTHTTHATHTTHHLHCCLPLNFHLVSQVFKWVRSDSDVR